MNEFIQILPNGYCLKNFPAELIAEIKDSLTFSNPKYEQAKQYSKWGKAPKSIPRYLWYYKMLNDGLFVPYGFQLNDFLPANFTISEKPKPKNKVTFSKFKLKLRETQQEAFDAYFNYLNKNNMNYGQIVLSTGCGKTILSLAIAAKLSVRTLVIVHKTDLLKVWQEDIAKALEMPAGIIQGSNRRVDDITVATIQTLNSMKKSGAFSSAFLNQFDLIIVDEAHHCPASTYDIIHKFQAIYRIGLTATPERNDGLTHVLNIFFGQPCYVYGKTSNDNDILPVRIIPKNIFLKYNPLVKIVKFDEWSQNIEISLIDEFPKVSAKDLRKSGDSKVYNISELRGQKITFPPKFNRSTMEKSIVNNLNTFKVVEEDLIDEVIDKGHSCICFFKLKEEVDWWYEQLSQSDNNFKIVKYYGDNSEEENKQALLDIENGKYNITLTTLAKCSEGTNCKAWESVFLISSIGNGKDVEQAIGRARRIKEGKALEVLVYDYRYPEVQALNLSAQAKERDYRYIELQFRGLEKRPSIFSKGYINSKFI